MRNEDFVQITICPLIIKAALDIWFRHQSLEITQMFFIDEWISSLWYTFIQWNSTQQRKRKIYPMTWMNCKSFLLGERSQTQIAIYCVFHLNDILEKAKLQAQKSNQWLPVAKGGVQGNEGIFWVMEIFHILIFMTVYIC